MAGCCGGSFSPSCSSGPESSRGRRRTGAAEPSVGTYDHGARGGRCPWRHDRCCGWVLRRERDEVAVTVTVARPALVGVPVMRPVLSRLSPAGSVPAVTCTVGGRLGCLTAAVVCAAPGDWHRQPARSVRRPTVRLSGCRHSGRRQHRCREEGPRSDPLTTAPTAKERITMGKVTTGGTMSLDGYIAGPGRAASTCCSAGTATATSRSRRPVPMCRRPSSPPPARS